MKTYILLLSIILMAGCVSTTQTNLTSSSVKSISSPAVIDGRWEGSFEVHLGRHQKALFEFKKNGDTLTGIYLYSGKSAPLLNGRIDGNKITFETRFEVLGTTVKSYYEGTMNGDQIRITRIGNLASTEGDGTMKVKGKLRRVN